MKVLSIVGARPEFIQSMPVSRALHAHHKEVLVHTGQHYDYLMSQKFFDELGISTPDYNLDVGSGSHAQQTAEILLRLEPVVQQEEPDIIVIRGDTNSTLAGALVASKSGIPLAHIEAGERSFNRQMPEEINRLVADRLADILLCASHTAVHNLAIEGITDNVYWVGDVMLDAMQTMRPIAHTRSSILNQLGISPHQYSLVTVHRAANTNNPQRLKQIVSAINSVDEQVVFPIHPRTRQALNKIEAKFTNHVHAIEPVGYFDMLALEANARLIATDSGGVQREAYYLGVPCITLRDETEWTETVTAGWNLLVGVDKTAILNAWHHFHPAANQPPIFGNGDAARKIVDLLASFSPAGEIFAVI